MKKNVKTKSKLPLVILTICLIILIIIGFFSFYFFYKPKANYQESYQKTWTQETLGSLEVDEGVVGYTLSKFNVGELKKIPLTSNTPKIEIDVDGTTYFIEIKDGKIISTLGEINNEDLKISMTRGDIINILNESNNDVEEIRKAINEGTLNIELIASKPELIAKGYFSIYGKFS